MLTVGPRTAAVAQRGVLPVLAALVAFLLAVLLPAGSVATARAEAEACGSQTAAVQADVDAIHEHNARRPPGGVGPPEVVVPYNQEANQLDARKAADLAKLRSCIAGITRLNASGPAPRDLRDSVRSQLEQARARVPAGWQAPSTAPRHQFNNKDVVVPRDSPARPVYDALRGESPDRKFPDVPLQDTPKPTVGSPVEAMPGQVVVARGDGTPAVAVDHIVPLAEIVQLPRFLDLTPDNMWQVANAPLNMQWLDARVNRAKGSKSVGDMLGLDDAWLKGQAQLQDTKRQELIEIIAQLADSQIN